MMDHMMGGAMMWGMGLLWLLVIIVLLLAAALVLTEPDFEHIQKMPRFARDLDA